MGISFLRVERDLPFQERLVFPAGQPRKVSIAAPKMSVDFKNVIFETIAIVAEAKSGKLLHFRYGRR
jgi:hypothetical protein